MGSRASKDGNYPIPAGPAAQTARTYGGRDLRARDGVDDVVVLEIDHEARVLPARDRRLAHGGETLGRGAKIGLDPLHGGATRGPRVDLSGVDTVQQEDVGVRRRCQS